MMGRSHLMLGAAGFLAVESVLPSIIGTTPLSPGQMAAGTLVAAGAGMIPDIDHPDATLAHCLPPASIALSRLVNTVSGGHRKGTHTIWCWLLVGLVAYWALQLHAGPVVELGIAIFCALIMFQVLTKIGGPVCLILAAIAGGAAVLGAGPSTSWMLQALIIGFGLHLVGDIVTTEGVPLLYPFGESMAIPVLGSTDHFREHTAGILCGLVAFYLLATNVFMPAWDAQVSVQRAAAAHAHHQPSILGDIEQAL
jgi:membrane-bound metal-dependent hydrolase YbcI (DUF457 family)